MENNKNKKSVKFQGDMLNFCDFIQVFVFTTNHHLNLIFSATVVCPAPKGDQGKRAQSGNCYKLPMLWSSCFTSWLKTRSSLNDLHATKALTQGNPIWGDCNVSLRAKVELMRFLVIFILSMPVNQEPLQQR